MSAHKYYNNYRKLKKERITDPTILSRLHALLKEIDDDSARTFLLSIQGYYEQFGGLTKKQFSALADVEKDNSEKASEKFAEWKAGYDSKKREIARICALYYRANPPYYAYVVEKIISDKNFVPTEKQYRSMCDNKYTQKVVRETHAKPKFKLGELVKGRKTADTDVRDRIGTIIEANASPVISSASGAKIYSILFFGEVETVLCEERYLKSFKKA
tara:strand:+ start:4147 stop:4794 length:648 start_codon:yes stop_codon:yes gene_type:complete